MSGVPLNESFTDSWMSKNEIFEFPPESTDEGRRRKDYLRTCWRRATQSFSVNEANLWFDKIFEKHCAEGRAYHTAVHLEEMLGFLDMIGNLSEIEYSVLALSIFFHDAVYDPRSSTNESDSADLFRDFFRLSNCRDEILEKRVVACILATQNHKLVSDDDCVGLLLDMDIAVLGKEPVAYRTYAGLIREEYQFVEHKVYCEKRAEILESFLYQPNLFCTEVFQSALEERARSNLKEEVILLKKGTIATRQ